MSSESVDVSGNGDEALPRQFRCERCGNCCRGEGDVYVSAGDLERIALHFGLTRREFVKRYCGRSGRHIVLAEQENHDCIFLDGTTCTIHEVKPTQCVKWPFWRSVVSTPQGFAFAKSYCEGLTPFEYADFLSLCEGQELH